MEGPVIILILLVLWEVILVAMILAMELEIKKKTYLQEEQRPAGKLSTELSYSGLA